jgi:hypothetical protein
MNSIICEPYRQMCLYMCVMVEALAVTTDSLTQFILVRPTGIRTVNLWISKQQPCILPLSYLVLGTFSLFYYLITVPVYVTNMDWWQFTSKDTDILMKSSMNIYIVDLRHAQKTKTKQFKTISVVVHK